MKRCPECRRDYNDDTLSYCLDDGMRLLDGPGTRDEPKTLVFHPIEAQSNEPGTLAILPFRNLTGDDSVSFYEFSLADAVITELARLRSLVVCPSSVVAKYLQQARDPVEIGSELNVNAVLAASFLLAKSRMRVTTQLIHVRTGKILWGERIDADA